MSKKSGSSVGGGTCVILDNGAGRIKYGASVFGQDAELKGSIPNTMAKANKQMQVLIGDQMEEVHDKASLKYTRPFERGYMTNPHCQIEIWKRVFETPAMLGGVAQPESTSLLITEPPFAPEPIQNDLNEVVFEEFGFQEYMRRPAAWFSAYEFDKTRAPPPRPAAAAAAISPRRGGAAAVAATASATPISSALLTQNCCTIIDTGFSFSHVFPFIDGKCKKTAVKRVNVGGKLLTNYLKGLVSLRQYDMADEFYLVDQVKEQTCYVSTRFVDELAQCTKAAGAGGARSGKEVFDYRGERMRKLFVLPDFQRIMRGFVKEDDAMEEIGEQILTMETERFAVPEVLFHPSDIGMNQAGICEAMSQCIAELSDVELGLCVSDVVLTGGNARLPQFRERFHAEIRSIVPDIFKLETHLPEEPQNYAWNGAARFVKDENATGTLSKHFVTRAEYLEYGHDYVNEKFFRNW